MENILEELNQTPGIVGSLIIGTDGLIIVPLWDKDLDWDEFGAQSADLINAAITLVEDKFDFGTVSLLTMETDGGKFLFKNIDDSTFMAVATKSDANLGLIRQEVASATEKIKEVL